MHSEEYGVKRCFMLFFICESHHVEINWMQPCPSLRSRGESHSDKCMFTELWLGKYHWSHCHKGIISKFLVFSTKNTTELLWGDRQRPATSPQSCESKWASPCQPCQSCFYGMPFLGGLTDKTLGKGLLQAKGNTTTYEKHPVFWKLSYLIKLTFSG